ncbi:long-chain fatty acid transporter [Betaproteobacteria bacterium SCN2]|jgi:long-chain fatty acid transport protein|nr:long-chain fatty acid transporter [Betaproteobacteria bacterium SCN2]
MKLNRIALAVALASLSIGAHATNGYFSHGYGMKAKGMAGVATTSTDDAFFGANNPAAAAFAGNRMELGADLFSPIREASNTGGGLAFASAESDSEYFLIPEFGYNRMVNNNLALGVTVYGNGGMNTDYPGAAAFGNTNMLGGTGSLGVDLMQLIVAPTVAYKVAPNHSIGISPLLGYQRFAATGIQPFAGMSTSPSNVSENGHDDAFGYGVRVGYLGKITPTVTIGAAYASTMNFEEFDAYKGLFAEQGDFDIPENYNLGVSWQATPALRLAFDYQRINYSDVNSVGNPVLPNLSNGLGSDNGPGFGWDDVDVWKLGVEYKYNKAWTLRAGYSHANNPISGSNCSTMSNCGEVMFNILAPAVVENHATLGFTYTLASGNELTVAYMHAFQNEASGVRPGFGGGIDKIEMYQNSLGIQYSWKM